MNEQAFTNALRAMRGAPRAYSDGTKVVEPWQVAIERLNDLESTLRGIGYLLSSDEIMRDKQPDELQARIEMRVQELRELITTGEIV